MTVAVGEVGGEVTVTVGEGGGVVAVVVGDGGRGVAVGDGVGEAVCVGRVVGSAVVGAGEDVLQAVRAMMMSKRKIRSL
ncbi:MAG: hypothetical protein JSU72_19050 [Deltaproteobacteria bacterium]|nr:MAG: hypothetical protein JSU72_19050 [Deltaproteobacteria bacterium]